jgi:hypothetical protein
MSAMKKAHDLARTPKVNLNGNQKDLINKLYGRAIN